MPPKQIRIPDLLRASKPTSALGGADVALPKLAGADVASRKLVGSDVVSARGKRSRGIALEGDGAVVEFGNSSTADIVGGDDVALLPERKRARRQIVPTMAAAHSLKSRPRGGEECARKELQSSACKKRDAEVPTRTVSARRRLSSEHGGTGSAVEGSSSAADIGDDEPNSEATGQVTGGDPSTSTSCSAILQGGGVTPEQLRAALSRRLTTENGELQISDERRENLLEQQYGGSPPSDVAAVKREPSQTMSDVGKAGNAVRVEEGAGRGRMPISTRRSGSVAESPSTSAPSSPRGASPRQIRTSPRHHLPPKPVVDVRAAPSSPKAVLDRGRGGKPLQSSLDGWARVQKGPTPLRNYGSRGSLMAALVLGKCGPPTPPIKSTPTGAVRELGAAEECEGVSETSRNSAVTEDAPGKESGGSSPRRDGILGWARRVTRQGVKGGMTSPERGPRREGGAVGKSGSPTLLKKPASMRDAEPAVQGVRSSGKLPAKYDLLEVLFDAIQSASKLVRARQHVCTYESIRRPVEELSNRRFLKSHLAQIVHVCPESIQLEYVRRQAPGVGLGGSGIPSTPSGPWELVIDLLPPQTESMAQTEGSGDVEDGRSRRQVQSPHKRQDIGWMEQNRRRKEIFRIRLVNILNEHGEDYDIPQAPLPRAPPSSTNNTPSRSRPQTPSQRSYPCTPSICSPPLCPAEPTTTPRPLSISAQGDSIVDNQSSCVKSSARRSLFKMGDLDSSLPRLAQSRGMQDSLPVSSLAYTSSPAGQESGLSSVSRSSPSLRALSPSSVRTRSQSLVEANLATSTTSTDLRPQLQKQYSQSQRRDLDARAPPNLGYLASLAEAEQSAGANACAVGSGTGMMTRVRCRRGLSFAFANVAGNEGVAAVGEGSSPGQDSEKQSMPGKEGNECSEWKVSETTDVSLWPSHKIATNGSSEVSTRSAVEDSRLTLSQSGNESDDDRAAIMRSLPRALLQSVEDRSRRIAEDTSDIAIKRRKQRMAMSELPRLFDMVLSIYKSANRTVMSRDDLLNRLCKCHCKLTSKDEIDLQLEYLLDYASDWISSKTAMTGEVLYRIQSGINTATIRRRLLSST